jgi:hypothetical protein
LAVLVEIVASSISSRMHSAKVHRRGTGYSSVEMENAEALLASFTASVLAADQSVRD